MNIFENSTAELRINHSKNILWINSAELLILLLLPLPFLHLNIFYVITAILIILSSKYFRREHWADYGFKLFSFRCFLYSFLIGLALGFLDNYITEPIIDKFTGTEPDLSSFEGVRGSLSGLAGMLALGWIVGGFFEEFFFRGYIFHRINSVIRNPFLHKVVCILVVSIVFAVAHTYQGISGIAGTFIFSVIAGFLYFIFRQNIWYLILIHGFYDTVGIFRLFMGN